MSKRDILRLTWRELRDVYFRPKKDQIRRRPQEPAVIQQRKQWLSIGYYRCLYEPDTGIVRHFTEAELLAQLEAAQAAKRAKQRDAKRRNRTKINKS
ncbi:hypothetical protein [Tuwongella immobilis]|uniref:Uncharacterized protein n=1 Tax=Tuwongella immobilis TaxID=692036 RepID=A0A6C2YR66_9BACT|nr:hypothetical protein [Tuwongella immobilis]VIP03976.1 unnamed protein product [Tuwongella immobilis]VTS05319.1 unnamed protein product [Tuwongella immobilis]